MYYSYFQKGVTRWFSLYICVWKIRNQEIELPIKIKLFKLFFSQISQITYSRH